MIKEAIFHKMDKEYCYALEAGKFLLKVRTKRDDMHIVNLKYTDKYAFSRDVVGIFSQEMTKVATDRLFDYYETVIDIDMICLRYYFEFIGKDKEVTYYGAYEFYGKDDKFTCDNMFDASQQVREEEIFETPEWARGAVVYQIFPERFARGSKREAKDYDDWNMAPMEYNSKLGGSLRGITENMSHIKELGVDVIYTTPIFSAPSNHKYDTEDYKKIDPEFGTEEDFKVLVEEAHQKGLKVILDGVFNHSGTSFLPFKDIMEKGQESKYWDWYYIKDFPLKMTRGEKPNFHSFAYYYGMPKLNTANPEVREYIFSVVDYWMNEFGVDGWRLDVSDEVSHDFWREFRKRVRKNNKDSIIIGEVWYESSPWLLGDEYDSVMNYLFRNPVRDWIAESKISVSDFADQMGAIRGRYHIRAHEVLWNLIDSHDAPRFLHFANEDKRKLKLAALLQMTMTGMPMVYYGDEYAMTGANDPDCRRGMVWDEEKQDKDMFEYYKKIIALRKDSDALKKGERIDVIVDDNNELYAFKKISGEEELLVIINANNSAVECDLHVGKTDLITNTIYQGIMPSKSGVILKIK
jgi:glycosidase